MELAIQISDVRKAYPTRSGDFVAIERLDLEVAAGDFVGIVGRSGSGKTTLLNLLAGIDRATSGSVRVADADLGSLTESGLAAWRGHNVGLVFQFFQLLPTLTVVENVMLPMDFVGKVPTADRRRRAEDLLELLGGGEHGPSRHATSNTPSSDVPRQA